MTLLSHLFSWFPVLHGLLVCVILLVTGINSTSSIQAIPGVSGLSGLLGGLAVLYLLPPLLFRMHQTAFPLRQGFSSLSDTTYSPWWGGHQIQGLFIALPFLEAILRLIPGCYTAWLRLWGARVGAKVYWTPRVEILDRSLVEIGPGVIFGHKVVLCSHVLIRRGNQLKLYVRRIQIGEGCLIGALSKLGPGARVAPKVSLPYRTDVGVNQKFPAQANALFDEKLEVQMELSQK